MTADVTHNHPEGIKGADSVAAAVFPAGTGSSRERVPEDMRNVLKRFDKMRTH